MKKKKKTKLFHFLQGMLFSYFHPLLFTSDLAKVEQNRASLGVDLWAAEIASDLRSLVTRGRLDLIRPASAIFRWSEQKKTLISESFSVANRESWRNGIENGQNEHGARALLWPGVVSDDGKLLKPYSRCMVFLWHRGGCLTRGVQREEKKAHWISFLAFPRDPVGTTWKWAETVRVWWPCYWEVVRRSFSRMPCYYIQSRR